MASYMEVLLILETEIDPQRPGTGHSRALWIHTPRTVFCSHLSVRSPFRGSVAGPAEVLRIEPSVPFPAVTFGRIERHGPRGKGGR